MTKLAILGDIHGNLPALEAVWADLEQFDVDRVIVAGDSVNWGPFSRQVLEFLAERGCAVIRGNHEWYVLDYDTPRASPGSSRYTMPPYVHRQIGDRWRIRIATWPDTVSLRFSDAPPVRVLHGSPGNHWLGIYPTSTDIEVTALLEGAEESTIVAAHTHLPMDRKVDGRHIVNPGSVGAPLDGILAASYVLLQSCGDGWRAEVRRVSFDLERVLDEFERQNFVKEHGIVGRLVVEEFRTSRIYLASFLSWHRACYPAVPITTELLEVFSDEARWAHTPAAYHVNREREP